MPAAARVQRLWLWLWPRDEAGKEASQPTQVAEEERGGEQEATRWWGAEAVLASRADEARR